MKIEQLAAASVEMDRLQNAARAVNAGAQWLGQPEGTPREFQWGGSTFKGDDALLIVQGITAIIGGIQDRVVEALKAQGVEFDEVAAVPDLESLGSHGPGCFCPECLPADDVVEAAPVEPPAAHPVNCACRECLDAVPL